MAPDAALRAQILSDLADNPPQALRAEIALTNIDQALAVLAELGHELVLVYPSDPRAAEPETDPDDEVTPT